MPPGRSSRPSATKDVLEGEEMARVFAGVRPDDLVWNFE